MFLIGPEPKLHAARTTVAAVSGSMPAQSGRLTTGSSKFRSIQSLNKNASPPAASAASRCPAVILENERKLAFPSLGAAMSAPEKKSCGKRSSRAIAPILSSLGAASPLSYRVMLLLLRPTRSARDFLVHPRRCRASMSRAGLKPLISFMALVLREYRSPFHRLERSRSRVSGS